MRCTIKSQQSIYTFHQYCLGIVMKLLVAEVSKGFLEILLIT